MERHQDSKLQAERRWLRMIPVLVVLATGYFILQPLIERDTSMPVSASACFEVLRVAGADAIRCEGEQTETLATSGLAGTDTRDDSPRGSAGGAHQNESSRGSSRSRGLTDADTAAEALRRPPHMTLADRCDAGIVDLGLHCNAGAQPTEKRRDTAEPTLMSSISGRVMGSDGFGLNGVTVIASPVPGSDADQSPNSGAASVRYRTVSDSAGFYSFRRLPDGDYTIRNNEHGPYPATRISAHTGVDYADLVLREKRTFVVEGRVVAATGEPLERVTVLPIVLGLPSVRTDDRGRYRLPITLEPHVSRLTLRFQLPGFRETYATVPAPSVVETDVQAFDAVMQPLEYTTSVIGTVTTTEGVPLVGRIVELRPVTEQRRYDAVTNVDGEFRFPVIEAPLEYRLHVSGAPDHKDYDHRIRITAENSELDLVVEPYEFGSLSGRVVNREGAPIPDFDLVLRNTASERPNALITSDADGNFTVPAAPAGEIVIASQSMPSFLLRGLHLHPEEELSVPLVVDWGAHEIRGLVVDRQGNPVPASRIVLKWYHQFDGLSSVATRRTAADAQGSFQFSQLGPGPHSLHVDAPGYGTAALEYDASRQGYDITVRLN